MRRLVVILTTLEILLAAAALPMPAMAASGRWTSGAPMPTARMWAAAATGLDGQIYVFGGVGPYYNPAVLGTVEAYDPVANTWTTKKSMPTPRYGIAASTAPDGRIFVIGGLKSQNGINNGVFPTVEAYNPGSDSWTTVASMSTPRPWVSATTGPDGRIYAFGGLGVDADRSLNSVEAYDYITNTWSNVAPMPTARHMTAATTGQDGKLYVISGFNSQTSSTSRAVEAYDTITRTWTALASLPSSRHSTVAATGQDGLIYVIDGYHESASPQENGPVNTAEIYDPRANSWQTAISAPTTQGYAAGTKGLDGRIYIMGGLTGGQNQISSVLDKVDIYGTLRPDVTPPATTGALSGKAGQNGWYVGPVTLTLSATDPMISNDTVVSGVASTSYSTDNGSTWQIYAPSAPPVFHTDGQYIVQYRSTDLAGNAEIPKSVSIYIDQTPPMITCGASPNRVWPPNKKLVQVRVIVAMSDPGGSGLGGYTLASITSNEGNVADEQQGFVIGAPSTFGQLLADRNADGVGRVYTLTYLGIDRAGNTANCVVKVEVPHDHGR